MFSQRLCGFFSAAPPTNTRLARWTGGSELQVVAVGRLVTCTRLYSCLPTPSDCREPAPPANPIRNQEQKKSLRRVCSGTGKTSGGAEQRFSSTFIHRFPIHLREKNPV